ncbi:MAG: endo-1,4-beta-xylanase [Oscillospiraceae bacterium]|nr:endo-1,4-beta-xylanase [Oscillospiraceae bacterium]
MKKQKAAALSLTAALLMTCTPLTMPVSAESAVLVNDTFEESFGTWKARTSGSTEISLSDSTANSGKKSLFIKGRTVNWNGAGASMIGVMFPDQKYDLSVAVRYDDEEVGRQNQQFNLQCLYTDATGKECYKYISSVNAVAGEWATIKGSYTVPSDASNIVVYVEANTLSDFYMDDFTVSGEKMEFSDSADGFSDDFEDGTKNGWQGRGSQTTLEITDTTAHSGKYSLYTDGRQQLWNGATCNKTLVLGAGGYYRFGCWVRYDGDSYTDTQKFSINLQYDMDGKENYYTIYTDTANKGEWTYIGTECTIPEGACNFYVYVQTAYKPEASVKEQDLMGFYLDDVTAERLPDPAIQEAIPSLKDVYKDNFKIGCAVASSEFSQGATQDFILKHHNAVTIGNELKPEAVLDQAATLAYMNANGGDQTNPQISLNQAAKMLQFCEENNLDLRGHVLVWHSQTPDWFFEENYDAAGAFVSPEIMDQRLENYIKNLMAALAEQYPKLHFYAWDVVNEAASDSGTIRKAGAYSQGDGSSGWVSVYGDQSYIPKAFTYARKYAPKDCKLFYNDYNEYAEGKLKYIQSEILQPLVDKKLIDGMGLQSHIGMSSPSIAQYEAALRSYAAMGLEVQVTELDVSLKSDSAEDLLAEAERYRQCFEMYKRAKADGVNLTAVTIWGITDSTSWIGGYPLLFDKNYQAKPAYYAVIDTDAPVQTVQKARVYHSEDTALAFSVQAENVIGSAGTFKAAWDGSLHLLVNAAKAGTLTVYSDLTAKPRTMEVKAGVNEIEIASEVNRAFKTGDSIAFDLNLNGENWNSLKGTPDVDSYGKLLIAEIPAIASAAQGTVKIDGETDAAWNDAPSVPISTFSLGTSGATGTAKLLWDKDNLYILAEVKDPVLSKASANAYEQDTVEIFFDENNHKSTSYEADDIQVRVNFDNEKTVTDGLTTERFTSAAVKTADGYRVEIAIPSTLGGFTPSQIVGFDAQINDDGNGEGKRTAISNWYDLSGMGYTDVSGLGLLKLLGDGEAPIETKPSQNGKIAYGDANEDGEVNILDVIKVNKYIVGCTELSGQALLNADVKADGNVDSADALIILKCAIGLVKVTDLPL